VDLSKALLKRQRKEVGLDIEHLMDEQSADDLGVTTLGRVATSCQAQADAEEKANTQEAAQETADARTLPPSLSNRVSNASGSGQPLLPPMAARPALPVLGSRTSAGDGAGASMPPGAEAALAARFRKLIPLLSDPVALVDGFLPPHLEAMLRPVLPNRRRRKLKAGMLGALNTAAGNQPGSPEVIPRPDKRYLTREQRIMLSAAEKLAAAAPPGDPMHTRRRALLHHLTVCANEAVALQQQAKSGCVAEQQTAEKQQRKKKRKTRRKKKSTLAAIDPAQHLARGALATSVSLLFVAICLPAQVYMDSLCAGLVWAKTQSGCIPHAQRPATHACWWSSKVCVSIPC
jgi:hypothetical protein